MANASSDHINILEKIDSRNDMFAPTGADISPDGKRLAVLTYKKLWIFTKPSAGKKWLTATPDTTLSVDLPNNIGQAEAISWDTDTTMTIINEKKRDFFRVNISNTR